MLKVINFTYTPPAPAPIKLKITKEVLRETLAKVRDALLRHDINGGKRKLQMEGVCNAHQCGTAACIGGWAGIFLLGFEGKTYAEHAAIEHLFGKLLQLDTVRGGPLNNLFYGFERTDDYNTPNVAATAIQRYLDGERPWPKGKMPNVLRYKRTKKLTKKTVKR